MVKLYRISEDSKLYWESWENDGVHTVHWGSIGTKGETKELRSTLFRNPEKAIQKEIDQLLAEGFGPIKIDDHFTLLIEFAVDGMGGVADIKKRHALQDRMDETLGWTGLGHCDGGSIGSGRMEVCCYVVDFEVAKRVIQHDLRGTEFANYTRIYDEGGC